MSLKAIHTKNLQWIDIVNPDEKDLDYLKNNFKFHPLDFEDVVMPATRTKIDEYDSYHFIILLFPLVDPHTNEIKPTEVDFFVGKNFVITIHDGSMRTLKNLVHNVQQYDETRRRHMAQTSGFLLFTILGTLFKRSAPILDRVNNQLLDSGKNIFNLKIQTLEKLSALKKNIIMYRRIVKMHSYVLRRLAHSQKEYLQFKDSKTLFADLIGYAENIWEVLSSDKESVESFEETNQSLGTHRINDILQVLTVLSVVIATLTLITDVLIFFEREHIQKTLGLSTEFHLFLFFTIILSLLVATMLAFFKKRGWL